MDLKKRSDVNIENTWNLDDLFKNLEQWELLFSKLENSISKIEKYKGSLKESAETIFNATKCLLETSREIEKLYVYASLRSDQDISNTENTSLKDRALNLYSRFSQSASFFSPELLKIDSETIDSYLKDGLLEEYKRTLGETLRYRDCLLYTSPSPRDRTRSRMPSSA